jgi:RNA polymerase sigma factor (sigma-70 family)
VEGVELPELALEGSEPADDGGIDCAASPSSRFEDFFTAEYRRVVGLAAVLCGRRAVAEELAQDAFVAAFRRWERISGYDDPAAWIRRVTLNLATSAFRRRTREAKALIRLAARHHPSAELTVEDSQFWEVVRGLPSRQAQCVALRYLEDRSVADIAYVLGISESTVRVHLHHALTTLAVVLDEDLKEVPRDA